MKRILITGANSYIGTSLQQYLSQWPDRYQVDTVDMRDGAWRSVSFSGYDTVYHVAGIAHSDNRKISAEKESLYRSVNTDLAIETAVKAKAEGVGQFIFMSSALVYGNSAPIGKPRIITRDTPASPVNFYGDSKWKAEEGIRPLESEEFKVVILRSPMIYGKRSRGNFRTLENFAKKMPFFPKVKNERSMLYIGNLTEFLRLMIDNGETGTFWPQNAEYSNTGELVKMIADAKEKKVLLIPGFGWALKILSHFTPVVNKAFGNLCYDKSMSEYSSDYRRYSLKESVEQAER